MGNSKRNRYDTEVQIAACQMYMGNPSITQLQNKLMLVLLHNLIK